MMQSVHRSCCRWCGSCKVYSQDRRLLLLLQGGISNGEDIVIKVAFKPTSTIGIKQQTVTREGASRLQQVASHALYLQARFPTRPAYICMLL
jgi:hypothetical protein